MEKLSVWGTGPSARKLAEALSVRRNVPADNVIRWKYMGELDFRCHTINKRNAIANASNKLRALQLIKEAGVDVPEFSTSFSRHDNIWFGRSLYHSKGRDIEVIEAGHRPVHPHDYYIRYMRNEVEYRYHVAFGKVILATKKVLGEGQVDDALIRNHQDGKWVQVTVRPVERYSEASIKSVKALGLDFGAVDFIVVGGKPYVLEVNTAPGLTVDNRLEAYATAIKQHVESR